MYIMKLFYYIGRLWKLPKAERGIFLRGVLYCFYTSLMVNLLPVKYYYNLVKPSHYNSTSIINKAHYFKQINKTISRILKFIPWKCSCLVKSLVYKQLLNYAGISSSIGLTANKDAFNNLVLHAYVKHENEPVYLHKKDNKKTCLLPY